MTSFINILPFVRKWEGGEVYFPTEKQWTNRGVQWNTYKQLAPKILGIQNPTVEGLRSMTESQGDKFVEYFWNKATNDNTINPSPFFSSSVNRRSISGLMLACPS